MHVKKISILLNVSSEIQSSLIKGKLKISSYFEIIFKELETRSKLL
jgi:hypothetical protein